MTIYIYIYIYTYTCMLYVNIFTYTAFLLTLLTYWTSPVREASGATAVMQSFFQLHLDTWLGAQLPLAIAWPRPGTWRHRRWSSIPSRPGTGVLSSVQADFIRNTGQTW